MTRHRLIPTMVIALALTSIAVAAAADAQPGSSAPPTPVFATSVDAVPISGQVFVTVPGGQSVPLTNTRRIPVGSTLDTTPSGKVQLIDVDGHGAVQSGEYWGGPFTVDQPRQEGGSLEVALSGPLPSCAGATSARANYTGRNVTGKTDPPNHSSGHSARLTPKARNDARDAAASTTTWTIADGCAGGQLQTAVMVSAGEVTVSNPVSHQTVSGAPLVKAGGPPGCYVGRFHTRGRYAAATVRGAPEPQGRPTPPTLRVLNVGTACGQGFIG